MAHTRTYEGIMMEGGNPSAVSDALIIEEALTIRLRGEALTVTMQTPGHERELTRGLLYTEGIWKDKAAPFAYSVLSTNDLGHVTEVNVDLPEKEAAVLNKRSLLSVSACGICGKTSLTFPAGKLDASGFTMPGLPEMFRVMRERQGAFDRTGGSHAAAAFGADEQVLVVREDVGRHNAVDKVIGHLLEHQLLSRARFLLVSGRISYEIVAKCFAAGIPVLAAVSAPSSLAVDFARELGITLLGFCRDQRQTIYSHPERFT